MFAYISYRWSLYTRPIKLRVDKSFISWESVEICDNLHKSLTKKKTIDKQPTSHSDDES